MTKWGREMTQSAVIVTGAANGIRYACAHDLLTDGVPVAATDIGEIPAALVNAGDCLPLSFDVSAEQSCQEAVAAATARFGGVRALIHFAGIHHTKTWDEVTGEDFAHVYAVNVTGSFLMACAAAGQMQESGGSIVLTASGAVYVGSVAGDCRGGPAYISSKAAIRGLTRSLARSLGKYGIRVNAASPGAMETPMIGT